MTIRIWRSYSSNNSSNFRLVARFAEPMIAAETGVELAAFIAAHVKEVAETKNRSDESYAGLELADKYGLDPNNLAMEGNGRIGDIEVAAIDDVVAVYHYSSLGFGEALKGYLRARGATTVEQNYASMIELSVLFEYLPGAAIVPELDALIAQNGRPPMTAFVVPWDRNHHGRAIVFRDAGTAGLFLLITPDDLPAIRGWLDEHGVAASLRLCESPDWYLFHDLAKARCTACGGLLHYLDPRIHDIEHPQLVCKPCGGLYELTAFAGDP